MKQLFILDDPGDSSLAYWDFFLTGILCTLLALCSILFAYRWLQKRKTGTEEGPALFICLFFGMMTAYNIHLNNFRYGFLFPILPLQGVPDYLRIINTMIVVAMFGLIATLELMLWGKRRYPIIATVVLIVEIILVWIIDIQFHLWIFSSVYPVLFPLIILWAYRTFKFSRGRVRKFVVLGTIGIALLTGFAVRRGIIELIFGPAVGSLVSKIADAASAILVAVGFFGMPWFTELSWDRKLRNLIAFSRAGLPLYSYNFQRRKTLEGSKSATDSLGDEMESTLVAGGLTGIEQLLGEVTHSKKNLQVVDHADRKLIFSHGEDIIIVLIADDDLNIIKYLLNSFRIKFEEKFGIILKNWKGDTDIFQRPADALIHEVFLS